MHHQSLNILNPEIFDKNMLITPCLLVSYMVLTAPVVEKYVVSSSQQCPRLLLTISKLSSLDDRSNLLLCLQAHSSRKLGMDQH